MPLINLGINIGGQQANVQYAGLAPVLAGLYQLNVTIPSGVNTGNVDVEILVGSPATDYFSADYYIATIPIGK